MSFNIENMHALIIFKYIKVLFPFSSLIKLRDDVIEEEKCNYFKFGYISEDLEKPILYY